MLNEAPCGFPPIILHNMSRPKLERQGVEFSPSSIQGCHRRYILQRDHDWYIDPDKAYYAERGTFFHTGMVQEAGDFVVPGTLGVIRELRMFAPIHTRQGMKRFSGQVDEILLLNQDNGKLHVRITDWKTKGQLEHSLVEAEMEHIYQVNEYAWLVREVLLTYMNDWYNKANPRAVFVRGQGLDVSTFTSVEVDELQVVYIGSNKPRTFSSSRVGKTKGKILGEKGEDGKWHRRYPIEHEELELAQIYMFSHDGIQTVIREGIEEQIDGSSTLAPPLAEERAREVCAFCGVRDQCITVGRAQGLDMTVQERL